MTHQIIQGNNIDVLKTFPDNCFDSIVTDPPYGIDFLGNDWDSDTGSLETYQECLRVLKPGGHLLAFSAARTYHHLAITIERAGFEIRDQIMWVYSSGFPKSKDIGDGRGTNLKPAHEPICMARKPTVGSITNNIKLYNTGAINIDDCRIPTTDTFGGGSKASGGMFLGGYTNDGFKEGSHLGRFPSNVMGEIEGYQKYYYCPKVNKAERGDNNHPTVKPVELMKYLVKLITPKNGTVLDPFNGSGSTGVACVEAGYNYVGIELDSEYVKISNKRLDQTNGLFVIE